MPPVSHQTIKLSRGRHSSAEHGACVMELASMLAGEGFSDHPRSVSRPIASFLRGYNDLVDDRRREDLYGYAAQGRRDRGLRRSRGGARGSPAGVGGRAVGAPLSAARCSSGCGCAVCTRSARPTPSPPGRTPCTRSERSTTSSHAAALALVDELIAMRAGPSEDDQGRADLATTAGP